MCGIACVWNTTDEVFVRRMMKTVVHRGPDANGMFVSPKGPGVLGHQRLSIMDPEGGNQPIFNEEEDKAIVANGEIYNFPALRRELEQRHTFKTTSDTEAVLHLFEEEGVQTASKLDGMFAFVIADGPEIYAARDAIGIKPLYMADRNGGLVFASELKSFDETCENVREFPPGTWFHSTHGFETFYTVPDIVNKKKPAGEYAKILRKTLEDSVEKRLMSDVPLGSFLSGGLDSSIIAAMAKEKLGELHTFSVGVEGSGDLNAARVVADHIGSIHHEHILTEEDLRKELPNVIYCLESFDQDLVRSAIPCYFVSRLAAKYVKVILTGEGADELFGGYTYYKEITDPEVLRQELVRSVASLHNINLQRVDRMTMAQSIEGRVPFLDTSMIRLGLEVPPELKLAGDPQVEKWILRKAVEDLLPDEIVWRVKEQFDEGSGTVDMINRCLMDMYNEKDVKTHLENNGEASLRSMEEAVYHKLFMDAFDDPDTLLSNVGRWAHRPEFSV